MNLFKLLGLSVILFSGTLISLSSQKIIQGNDAQNMIPGAYMIRMVPGRTAPDYVEWRNDAQPSAQTVNQALAEVLGLENMDALTLIKAENDNLGFTHYRYQHLYHGIPVENSGYKVHMQNGKIISMNGAFFGDLQLSTSASITPENAITAAKNKIGAEIYQWEIPSQEDFIKEETGNPSASFKPVPELVIVAKNADYKNPDFHLAWKMDIYANKPVSRQDVFIDAMTGEVLYVRNKLCHVDAPSTGTTAFSGSRNFTSDSFSGSYRLREAGRGNGIRTFDVNNGTTYTNTDFTNATTSWTAFSPAIDRYALDAHWGAEMTYDYYMTIHGRNSIDGAGFALLSYVHYDVDYGNAFWDGNRMTYGDGDGGTFNEPLTTLDITGHEITHGLTEHSAGLEYQDEPGGLNESFSDIFGVCIDNFARGTSGSALWRMGEECTSSGGGIRNMQNPGSMGQPDTYEGTYWINAGGPDYGGVHTNSGVQNYWFYLLCQGGSGTNDNGDTYSVTAIGMADAARITFRNLTVYLDQTSQYADARFYAIKSAQDIFGGCTPQVIATTNAWYAVGVGPAFVADVTADFTSSGTTFCSANIEVNFTNTSNNGSTYSWNFGDGGTSTAVDPSHTYLNPGTYNVTLMVDGGLCGGDTLVMNNYITINSPAAPLVSDMSTCNGSASFTIPATASDVIRWYTTPSGGTPIFTGPVYTTPVLSSSTTYYVENSVIQPAVYEGPTNTSFGTGGNHNNTSFQYLTFDVTQPCTLVSVWVNASGSGNRDIVLWDATGTVINTYTVNIPNGSGRVTVNIPLQPGSYRIGGTEMSLYRNNAGAAFPYNTSGIASITGSSAGGGFYYYFYDWELLPDPCTSARVPVNLNVGALPTASFTFSNSGPAFNFNSTSVNANTWSWDFGDGGTSTLENPSHTYGANGSYTVTLIVENEGCTDTIVQNIQVGGVGIENETSASWNIYPNPFTSEIYVSLDVTAAGELNIYALNALGQRVADIYSGSASTGHFTYQWKNLQMLPAGIYMIRMELNGKDYVKKLVKNN